MISCQNNQLAGYFYTVLGNLKKLDEEVRKNPKILDEKDPHERNPPHTAARNGHVDVREHSSTHPLMIFISLINKYIKK